MKIKIFNKRIISFDALEEKGGFEALINAFCSSVDVIDIVVLSVDEIVIKYKDFNDN